MIVNLSNFKHLKLDFFKFYNLKKDTEEKEILITRAAMYLGCPLIVIIYFLKDEFGTNPWIEKKIETLKKFYDYEEIIE
jgi:hypothetical protein